MHTLHTAHLVSEQSISSKAGRASVPWHDFLQDYTLV
jgi:hypothetical protein